MYIMLKIQLLHLKSDFSALKSIEELTALDSTLTDHPLFEDHFCWIFKGLLTEGLHHAVFLQESPWRPPSQYEEYHGSQNGSDHLHDGESDLLSHSFNSMRAQERNMNDSDLERHFANQGRFKRTLTICCVCVCALLSVCAPRSEELQTQKLKSHLVRTQRLNILPLKPGVGQYRAIPAMLTARDFFLAYFYPSGPFTCTFSKTSPDFCCVGCG